MSQQTWRTPPAQTYALLDPNAVPSAYKVNDTTSVRPLTNTPRRRYWKRTILVIVAPLLVTAFYYVIWLLFIRPRESDAIKFGDIDEQWIFYVWFIVGVFGLDWSKDGLLGVEAAMLESRTWRVRDMNALKLHVKTRWSGPEGWFYTLKFMVRVGRGPSGLFWLLTVLSLLVFIGLPLSGLSQNLSDGYIHVSTAPEVIGRTWESFNARQVPNFQTSATNAWEIGPPATLPGFGLLYTPDYLNRKDYTSFDDVPNTLPLVENIPDIFLAPQAKMPVSGKGWGLRASYNCTMVDKASDFTILSQKSESSARPPATFQLDEAPWLLIDTPGGQAIYVYVTQNLLASNNLWGYVEMGVTSTALGTYNESEPESFEQGDTGNADIFEFALWQLRFDGAYGDTQDFYFNDTLSTTIERMPSPVIQADNGTWVRNNTFFEIKDESGEMEDYGSKIYFNETTNGELFSRTVKSVAKPIGVRCEILSSLGTAQLNPRKSSFSSFEKAPPPWDQNMSDVPVPRLGGSTESILRGNFFQIFTSTGSPSPETISNSYSYHMYIQPETLAKSIRTALAMEALQMMYDGTYGFEGAAPNANMTSSKSGKLLTAGDLPPSVPAIFFSLWAIGSVSLGLIYGFRKRWSDKLDSFSVDQLRASSVMN